MSIKCVLYVRWYDDAVNLYIYIYIYLGTMGIELNSVVNVQRERGTHGIVSMVWYSQTKPDEKKEP